MMRSSKELLVRFDFYLFSFSLAFLVWAFSFGDIQNVAYAQLCDPVTNSNYARTDGLVTANTRSGVFSTLSGYCFINPKARIGRFRIEDNTYSQLKAKYYDRNPYGTKIRLTGNQVNYNVNFPNDRLILIEGDLTIDGAGNSNITPNGTSVIFVDGNLYLDENISLIGSAVFNKGVVFVVQGNIVVDQSVSQIDAVLISFREVCTYSQAPTSHNCSAVPTAPSVNTGTFVLNGSYISLYSPDIVPGPVITIPIKFRRNLADNALPAERVFHQAKYMAILSQLFSDSIGITSEDTNYAICSATSSRPKGCTCNPATPGICTSGSTCQSQGAIFICR